MKEMEDEAQKKKQEKKIADDTKTDWRAIMAYTAWKFAGRPMEVEGGVDSNRPKLKKDQAIAIVKGLIPSIDPTDAVSKYNGKAKAVDRLVQFEGQGSNWEDEMEKFAADYADRNGIVKEDGIDITQKLF